jgi:GWxTD domain-containing protein
MLKTRRFFFSLLTLLLTADAIGQVELANRRAYDLPFFFLDMVNVRSQDASKSRLLIFIKVPYDELQFVKLEPDSFVAKYEISMIVLDEDDFQSDSKILQRTISVPSFEETNERGKYDYLEFYFDIDPGEYKAIVGLMDKETQKTITQKTKIELRDFKKPKISISDVLIADSVQVEEDGSVTTFPHVNLPREQSNRVLGYFQVYTKKRSGKLNVGITVRNPRKKKVFEDNRDFVLNGEATPIVFEIAEGLLSHGLYRVKIRAKTGGDKAELEMALPFFSRGMPLTSADLKSAIKQLQYIASGKEIDKIKDAPADSQKAAFVDFWKERDPSPGTEENELMTEFYRRIAYANEHFGRFTKGWKSDMGMIYVILGEPNDVERNPFVSAYVPSFSNRPIKALEVWHYYRYNRYFVFVDDTGFGDFRLTTPVSLNDLFNISQR